MASRIGIIGLGTIGKTHWRVIRESPQTTLIAVADPAPSAVDFARAESIPAYTDYQEMTHPDQSYSRDRPHALHVRRDPLAPGRQLQRSAWICG